MKLDVQLKMNKWPSDYEVFQNPNGSTTRRPTSRRTTRVPPTRTTPRGPTTKLPTKDPFPQISPTKPMGLTVISAVAVVSTLAIITLILTLTCHRSQSRSMIRPRDNRLKPRPSKLNRPQVSPSSYSAQDPRLFGGFILSPLNDVMEPSKTRPRPGLVKIPNQEPQTHMYIDNEGGFIVGVDTNLLHDHELQEKHSPPNESVTNSSLDTIGQSLDKLDQPKTSISLEVNPNMKKKRKKGKKFKSNHVVTFKQKMDSVSTIDENPVPFMTESNIGTSKQKPQSITNTTGVPLIVIKKKKPKALPPRGSWRKRQKQSKSNG